MFHRWLVISRLIKMCPLHTYSCVFVNHIPQLKKKRKNENLAVFSNMSPESGRGGTKTQEWARVTHHIFTPICALKAFLLHLSSSSSVVRFGKIRLLKQTESGPLVPPDK